MNIKITYHLMPWEIDYALLTFTQLKKSLYYIPSNVTLTIDSVLNLSSNMIDWEKSKLPKEYFIEKYNTYSLLLDRGIVHNKKIYEGDKLYGHLDLQKNCIGKEFTHYMNICPDLYFSETALASMIHVIPIMEKETDHYIAVPEIFQMWDISWSEIVGPEFKNVHYDNWYTADVFDIRAVASSKKREDIKKSGAPQIGIRSVKNRLKWTGWFDLYSKDLYEKIIIPPKEWIGYGPWDLFGMNVIGELFNKYNLKFLEFVISEKVGKYSTGPLNTKPGPHTGYWMQSSIKKFIQIKENNSKEHQRQRMGKDGNPLQQMKSTINERIKQLQKNKKLWKNIFTEEN